MQSQGLWQTIEPSVGLLRFLIECKISGVPNDAESGGAVTASPEKLAKLQKQLVEKEKEVNEKLAKLQQEIDAVEGEISRVREAQATQQGSDGQIDQQLHDLEKSKAQKQAQRQRLIASTEERVNQKEEYRCKITNFRTGSVRETHRYYSVEEILAERPNVPELRIEPLQLHPNNYLRWALQVRTYLFARGVSYVLDESDDENVPGVYDNLYITLRDRDDALARFIISTALTEMQCGAYLRGEETAKQFWRAIKLDYKLRDGPDEEFVTPAQILARLKDDATERGGRGNEGRRGRGRGGRGNWRGCGRGSRRA